MGNTELGIRLKQARERAGLKQAQVIEQADIPKVQTLSSYERGINNPPIEILKKLSVLYGVTIDSLVYGEEHIPQKEKTPVEYVRQLVDAVDHLQITFESYTDSYTNASVHRLDLSNSRYLGLSEFAEKWVRLRSLLDSGIIEPEEYDSLITQRLNQLVLQYVEPDDGNLSPFERGELPF